MQGVRRNFAKSCRGMPFWWHCKGALADNVALGKPWCREMPHFTHLRTVCLDSVLWNLEERLWLFTIVGNGDIHFKCQGGIFSLLTIFLKMGLGLCLATCPSSAVKLSTTNPIQQVLCEKCCRIKKLMLNYKQIYCMELQLYDSLLLTSNVFLDMLWKR